MDRFFNRIGDKMPHQQKIHLPHFMSRKMVYDLLVQDIMGQGFSRQDIISGSHFYALWRDKFQFCTIPKHSLFSKCDTCVKFANERLKVAGDKAAKEKLSQEYKQHLELVTSERNKYYHHREKARSEPSKYLSVIIDGMDQNKTNVPHVTQETKSTQNLWRLRSHLTGALVHTKSVNGKVAFAFFDLMQWPHDSNLTIAVLNLVLVTLQQAIFDHPLPPVLYVQLDNTARENKNKYVFSYLALLVQLKIFKKIRVNFLPVGHTHEDVDQFFSKVSTQLKRLGAETISDLHSVTEQSFTPEPITAQIQAIHDVRSWLIPHIEDLHGHSQPHCFRFTLNKEGIAEMHFKTWNTDKAWSKEGLLLLKGVPQGSPCLCIPSSEKQDLNLLRADIRKWRQWLSDDSYFEWEQFLDTGIEELDTVPTSPPQFALTTLQQAHADTTCENDDSYESPTLLVKRDIQVYTGKRRAAQPEADLSLVKTRDLVAIHHIN